MFTQILTLLLVADVKLADTGRCDIMLLHYNLNGDKTDRQV